MMAGDESERMYGDPEFRRRALEKSFLQELCWRFPACEGARPEVNDRLTRP